MEQKRSVGITILGILILIAGIISTFNNLGFMKSKAQYGYEEDLKWELNTMLTKEERILPAMIEKNRKNFSDPRMQKFFDSQQADADSEIKEIKRCLQPEVLKDNAKKLANFHYLFMLSKILNFIFGIILLISSIGIFIHAPWLNKLVYVTIPASIIWLLMYAFVNYIELLVMPKFILFWGYIIIMSILTVLSIGYNLFLYITFTRPKVKEQLK